MSYILRRILKITLKTVLRIQISRETITQPKERGHVMMRIERKWYADNESLDQPAHERILIRALILCIESTKINGYCSIHSRATKTLITLLV